MNCLTGKTSGTCVPECPYYGQCHCGCGGKTRRYNKNGNLKFVANHYCINMNGHHANRPHAHPYSRVGVKAEKLHPLALLIRREVGGSREAAAALVGLPMPTFNALLYRKYVYASPNTAERVIATVLAIRSRRNPSASHVPRLPTNYEQGLVPNPERERNRLAKRSERKAKREMSA